VDKVVDGLFWPLAALLNPPHFSVCLKKRQFFNLLIQKDKSKVKESSWDFEKKQQRFRHKTVTFCRLCTTRAAGRRGGRFRWRLVRFCKGLRRDLKSMT